MHVCVCVSKWPVRMELTNKNILELKAVYDIFTFNIIIIHTFYRALFSALKQTHYAHWHVILTVSFYSVYY